MTTLGSLAVGLLVLVLVAAVGIALLAWRRRRSPRGPEQPRTVADLVKMREAAAQAEAPVSEGASDVLSAPAAGSDAPASADELTAVAAAEPAAPDGAPGAEASEEASSEAASEASSEEASEPAAGSGAEAGEVPDAAAPLTTPASLQDTPWARAARMADPRGEWTASARAAREREATFGPRLVPPVAPKDAVPAKSPTPPSRPRLSLLHSDRPEPVHDTTTIANLPQAFAQAAATSQPPAADAPAAPAADARATPAAEAPAAGATPAPSAAQQVAETPSALADQPTPAAVAPQQIAEGPGDEAASVAVEGEQPAEVGPKAPDFSDGVTGPIVLPTLPQAPGHLADDETVEIGRGFSHASTVHLPQGFGAQQAAPTRPTLSDEPTTRFEPPASEPAHPEAGAPEADDVDGGGSAPQDRDTTFDEAPVAPVVALVGAAVAGSGSAAAPTNGHAAAPTNGHAAAPTNGHAATPKRDHDAAPTNGHAAFPTEGEAVVATNGHAVAPANGHASAPADGHTAAPSSGHLAAATNGAAPVHTPARVAGRVRRSPADTAAEQAAADLALLRTFGVAGPGHTAAADDTEIELEGCGTDDAEPSGGAAQPVSFRVVGRDGRGLAGASVTLLDDHGREIAGTVGDEQGAGTLTARRPGGYMLVTAAAGYQPGAVAITVSDAAVDAEIPLTRSASIAGSVGGEDGPIVGAHLVLVQDGEIVETAESGADGAYRFADLAAGEYGLSVSASEWEPAAIVLRLIDEVDLRHDIDLDPAGLPTSGAPSDVMIGHL